MHRALWLALLVAHCEAVAYQKVEARYGRLYTLPINSSVEWVFDYGGDRVALPKKVLVSSAAATKEVPLLVVAQQERRITSWQIPYAPGPQSSLSYQSAGHTLCPSIGSVRDEATRLMLQSPQFAPGPVVAIKSSSRTDVSFSLLATVRRDFFLEAGRTYAATVSASEPVYHYYNFHDEGNGGSDLGAVLLSVRSDSCTCMVVGVQDSTCPVFDLESNVRFGGGWQTMDRQAAVVVTRDEYPHGFYVVMVVKQTDDECTKAPAPIAGPLATKRVKEVTFSIEPTISRSQHLKITMITLGVFAAVFVACTVAAVVCLALTIRRTKNTAATEVHEVDGLPGVDGIPESQVTLRSHLFKPSQESRRTTNYVWHVAIVALFYSLPVLQLVLTYQGIVHVTGNEDLCYYNFLCAHPLGFITDFNHVFSNVGYVLLGILFFIIAYVKELQERSRLDKGWGLPKPFGMYKAMAFALIMEGVLSACYHICPKMSNFQFDTSFMYVMAVLMTVNIYESRHSAVDVRGYIVFGMLAVATTLSVIGSYFSNHFVFWTVFTVIHIIVCLLITWFLDKNVIKKLAHCGQGLTRVEIYRLIFWVLGNLINIGLATFGFVKEISFATHLLIVLIVNCLFYLMFYIFMKVIYVGFFFAFWHILAQIYYKERILPVTWVLIVLSGGVWAGALYFFVARVTSWEVSPAESRSYNQGCWIADYYDSHDIWHFLSAIALFFSFIILLTLDEGLSDTRNSDIPDFHGH